MNKKPIWTYIWFINKLNSNVLHNIFLFSLRPSWCASVETDIALMIKFSVLCEKVTKLIFIWRHLSDMKKLFALIMASVLMLCCCRPGVSNHTSSNHTFSWYWLCDSQREWRAIKRKLKERLVSGVSLYLKPGNSTGKAINTGSKWLHPECGNEVVFTLLVFSKMTAYLQAVRLVVSSQEPEGKNLDFFFNINNVLAW